MTDSKKQAKHAIKEYELNLNNSYNSVAEPFDATSLWIFKLPSLVVEGLSKILLVCSMN